MAPSHATELAAMAFGLGMLVARPASSAEPTKLECITANEDGQRLKREGKLAEARARLELSASASCPGPVREDSEKRLAEITEEEAFARDEAVPDDAPIDTGPATDAAPPPAQPANAVGALTSAGYVSLGVGAAGVLASVIVGGVAAAKASSLRPRCPGGLCPPAYQGDLDQSRALADATTALIVIGGLASAVGTTLLLVSMGDEEPATARLEALPGGMRFEAVW